MCFSCEYFAQEKIQTSDRACMAFIKNVNITLQIEVSFFSGLLHCQQTHQPITMVVWSKRLPLTKIANKLSVSLQCCSTNKPQLIKTTIFKTSHNKVRPISLASCCSVFSDEVLASASNCVNDIIKYLVNQDLENSSIVLFTRDSVAKSCHGLCRKF